MIRRSTAIATVAILLSLLVHFLGLGFTSRRLPEQPAGDGATDVIALDNSFEDVAEAPSAPVEPDPAPTPEPPAETAPEPEPETAETPTSEALVASPDPQQTLSPDTGAAQAVEPPPAAPSEPEQSSAPEPETVQPEGGEPGATPDTAAVPPAAPVRPVAADPGASPPPATAPQSLAALPNSPAPVLPVTPPPEPSTIPVIPLVPDIVNPASPDAPVQPTPEEPQTAENGDDSGSSDLAVAASLRPQLPPDRPVQDATAPQEGSAGLGDLGQPPAQLIESPLTVYKRDGVDLFNPRSSDAQTGGLGFLDSRGAGNATTTNYAGRVLVHLNRAAAVRVAARGYARVIFEINPDGTLAWVDIIDGSGSQEVNLAAKTQVRNASPFPPPPDGASRKLAFVYRSN